MPKQQHWPYGVDDTQSQRRMLEWGGELKTKLSMPRPDNGLTMNRGAVVGCASAVSFGTASAICEIFTSAEA